MPGIALTSFNAFEAGITASEMPVAISVGTFILSQLVLGAIPVPGVHHRSLVINEGRR